MQSLTFNPGFGIKMVELVYFFLSHRKLNDRVKYVPSTTNNPFSEKESYKIIRRGDEWRSM